MTEECPLDWVGESTGCTPGFTTSFSGFSVGLTNNPMVVNPMIYQNKTMVGKTTVSHDIPMFCLFLQAEEI